MRVKYLCRFQGCKNIGIVYDHASNTATVGGGTGCISYATSILRAMGIDKAQSTKPSKARIRWEAQTTRDAFDRCILILRSAGVEVWRAHSLGRVMR